MAVKSKGDRELLRGLASGVGIRMPGQGSKAEPGSMAIPGVPSPMSVPMPGLSAGVGRRLGQQKPATRRRARRG
jgi:hypothetical protein